MAFTKVLPSGISTTSTLTVDSLDSVGAISATSITATTGTFSGNLNVAGVLTYEDVTNVDSVGLVTARSGIHVTGGSVGIGTDNPTSALEIRTTTTNSATHYRNNASNSGAYFGVRATELGAAGVGEAYIYSYNSGINLLADGTGDINFATGGTASRVRITSDGLVGIGLTNPDKDLTIASSRPTIKLIDDDVANNAAFATIDASSHAGILFDCDPDNVRSSTDIRFNIDGEEKVRITSSGNVGIGTINPGDSRLFIDRQYNSTYATNAYNDDFLLIKNNSTTDGTAASIYMLATGSGNSAAVGTINLIHTNNGSGALSFQTRNNGSMIEAVRIASSGNVGIGTDNPGTIESWSPAGTYLHVGGSTASGVMMKSNYPRLVWNEMDQGANSAIFQINMSEGQMQFQHINDDGSIKAERLRINSDGNIGINQGSPSEKLEVYAGDILLSSNAAGVSGGVGPDAALKFEYNGHQYAKIVGNGRDSSGYGDIDFYTSTSAGITNLTQRMTIRADGKVGIGTDNPTQKLDINGSVTANDSYRLDDSDTSAVIQIQSDISGNYTGWKERNVASGSMSQASIDSKTPTINDFTYPNSSNGMLIWSTNKIGFAAGSESPQYGTGVQMLYDASGLALSGYRAFDRTSTVSSSTANIKLFSQSGNIRAAGNGKFDSYLQANPLALDGSSWIRSSYGAISQSSCLSLNNLLIGQNMRGYRSDIDGGSTDNSFRNIVTYNAGTMGHAGTEYTYGGITKFYNGTAASTANTVFTPVLSMHINGNGHVTKPKNPSFAVTWSTANTSVSANSQMQFDSVIHNIGSHYSTSTYRFTAPVAGTYQINFYSIYYEQDISNAAIYLYVNNARIYGGDIHFSEDYSNSRWSNVSYSMAIYLNSGDYIYLLNGSVAILYHGRNWSRFSGYLVG